MTTILLGKDCSTFLETDESVLQRGDVRLVWAETVDAFVPLAREHRPDLCVLDPQVPGFDAFACARELLEVTGEDVVERVRERSVPFGATNQAPAPLEREPVWPSGATADGPPARLSAARTARAETGKSGSSGLSE